MIRGAALALAVGAASPAIAGNAILFAAEDATFVVTSNDVAEAVAIENDGTHVVYVTLDLALTDGLASFTKTQIGNPVAVSVCERELMRPVVQAVIETPAFVF